jgi:hypothetical protein
MKDIKRFTARMGFTKSPVIDGILPLGEVEGTCPLCGHFMPLDRRGYCGTEECGEAATRAAREIAKEKGDAAGNVPGLYYKIGGQEIVNFTALEKWKEPQPTKTPDMCTEGECTDLALPGYHLCRHHKLTEKREAMQARNQAKRNQRNRRRRGKRQTVGNRIKGLDKLK